MPRYNLLIRNVHSPSSQRILKYLVQKQPALKLYPVPEGAKPNSFYYPDVAYHSAHCVALEEGNAIGLSAQEIVSHLGNHWNENISLYIQELPN